MATVVGTTEILNTGVTILADQYGSFLIEDENGVSLGRGTTLDAAKVGARAELNKRRVNVSIPFITEDGRHGVATKRDTRSRDVRVTWADGTKGKVSTFSNTLKPDIPMSVLGDLQEHQREIEFHQAEVKSIRTEWSFSLRDAVDEAVKAAATEAESD